MSIPEIDIEGIRCVSGHFHGVHIQPDGSFIVGFCIREGFDGSDIVLVKQEVQDLDNFTLDRAVVMGRNILADNLEQLAKDIRTGVVEPDDDSDEGEDG